jgi:hypothetical protein
MGEYAIKISPSLLKSSLSHDNLFYTHSITEYFKEENPLPIYTSYSTYPLVYIIYIMGMY